MRISLRFVVPLALALTAIAYAVVPLVDRLTLNWFVRDLEIRAKLITSTTQEPLAALVREPRAKQKVLHLFERIVQDERIFALGFCDNAGKLAYATRGFPAAVQCPAADAAAHAELLQRPDGPLHVSAHPVALEGETLGSLVIVHDMSFVQRRSEDTKRYVFYLFATIAAIVAVITVVIAEISWRGWVAGIKMLISGEALLRSPEQVRAPELRPIANDLQALVRDLESERRSRDESQVVWGPDALRRILRQDLRGDEVLIVSNREPYIHVRKQNVIEIQRPASGLVTALEPIMRACSGTWIAHGSGSADREAVDAADHVMVPPERPAYRIRRVWLTKEEEQGYYYGFANEGLWPLCHIAHVRPIFRAPDWEHYRTVNRRFADAVVDEARTEDPIVLVQDYHFALLPRLVRERAAARHHHHLLAHPVAESRGVRHPAVARGGARRACWARASSASTRSFTATTFSTPSTAISRRASTARPSPSRTAASRPRCSRYPISIEWPPAALATQPAVDECRSAGARARLGVPPDVLLGVGVDRLDYTKGILERFMAVERLLELEPRWIGKFSFVQIAAPSRSSIDEYQSFDEQGARRWRRRSTDRFGRAGYEPIILLIEHHDATRGLCAATAPPTCATCRACTTA